MTGFTEIQVAFGNVVKKGDPLVVRTFRVAVWDWPFVCAEKLSGFLSTLKVCAETAAAVHTRSSGKQLK